MKDYADGYSSIFLMYVSWNWITDTITVPTASSARRDASWISHGQMEIMWHVFKKSGIIKQLQTHIKSVFVRLTFPNHCVIPW